MRGGREVTDRAVILDVLWKCDAIHVGMSGVDGPYVTPASFGVEERRQLPDLTCHAGYRWWQAEFRSAIPKRSMRGMKPPGATCSAAAASSPAQASGCAWANQRNFSRSFSS